MSPRLRIVLIALALVAGAGIGWWASTLLLPSGQGLMRVQVGGPFRLTGHDGRERTDADFRGNLMLLGFGYTNCPDVCPLLMNTMGDAFAALGPLADRVQGVFVSVDPQRDTPERLRDYAEAISPRILGMTGTRAQIDAAVRAYRAYYRIADDAATNPHYTVDHTALLYLMGRDGALIAHFSHQTPPAAIVEAIRRALAS